MTTTTGPRYFIGYDIAKGIMRFYTGAGSKFSDEYPDAWLFDTAAAAQKKMRSVSWGTNLNVHVYEDDGGNYRRLDGVNTEGSREVPAGTKPAKRGHVLLPCMGEAHSNPFIDNCMVCAPRWGWIEVKKSDVCPHNRIRTRCRECGGL